MTARRLYLVLSILGLTVPSIPFWQWVARNGFAPRLFVEALFANGVSAFFGLDVIISGLVLIAFVLIEGRRLRIPRLWLPIAGVLLAGVSFGLPLFLYQRERHAADNQR
jgi:hypothetical protein